MDKKELIKILEKNGFKKSSTKHNKSLMEWTKNDCGSDNFIMVYIYDVCEIYFDVTYDSVFFTIEQLEYLYNTYTNEKLIL